MISVIILRPEFVLGFQPYVGRLDCKNNLLLMVLSYFMFCMLSIWLLTAFSCEISSCCQISGILWFQDVPCSCSAYLQPGWVAHIRRLHDAWFSYVVIFPMISFIFQLYVIRKFYKLCDFKCCNKMVCVHQVRPLSPFRRKKIGL